MNKSTDDNALAKVKTELENIGTQNLASYLSPIKPVFLVKALIKQKFEKDNIPQNMSDLLKTNLGRYDEGGLKNWIEETKMYNDLTKQGGEVNKKINDLVKWANDEIKSDNDKSNIKLWIKITKIFDEFYDVKLVDIYKNLEAVKNEIYIGESTTTDTNCNKPIQQYFDDIGDIAQPEIKLFGKETALYNFDDDKNISRYYYDCLIKLKYNSNKPEMKKNLSISI